MSLWQQLKDEFSSSTVIVLPGDFMWRSPLEVAGLVASRVVLTKDENPVEEKTPSKPNLNAKAHTPSDYDSEFPIYDNGIFEIVIRGVDEDSFLALTPTHIEHYLGAIVQQFMDDPYGEVDMGCFGPPLRG